MAFWRQRPWIGGNLRGQALPDTKASIQPQIVLPARSGAVHGYKGVLINLQQGNVVVVTNAQGLLVPQAGLNLADMGASN